MMLGRRRGWSLVAAGPRICCALASPVPRRAAAPVMFKTTGAAADRAVDDPGWGSSTVAIPPDTVVAAASRTTIWHPAIKVFIGQGLNLYQVRSPADTDSPEKYDAVAMAEMSPRAGLILSRMQGGEMKKIVEISFRGVIGDSSTFPLPPSTGGDGEGKEGEKPFYPRLQFGLYPKKKFGWMSVLQRSSRKRYHDSTVTFLLSCLKSCNSRDLRYFHDPSEGLLFEGELSEDEDEDLINDLIMRLDTHYVLGSALEQKNRDNLYEAVSWDSSNVHLRKILSNSVHESIDSSIGKSLSHRGILRIHSSFRESATEVYIAYDACTRSLPDYLSVTEFVLKDRLWKCVDLADAVKSGNEVHLVNPAINMNEILVTEEGQVKILNYGKAMRKQVGKMIQPIHGNGGTGNYCAPELRKRRPFDEKAEVFAIGKVFVCILVDRKDIVKAMEELNLMVNHSSWKKDKLKMWRRSRLWKDFKCKEDLVLSMLDDDPENRPDICTVIKELLAEIDVLEGDEEEEEDEEGMGSSPKQEEEGAGPPAPKPEE